MNYLQLRIVMPPGDIRDGLLADLSDLGMESFEERDDALLVYHPVSGWSPVLSTAFRQKLQEYNLTFTKKEIEGQNWNALWESNFSPIRVGNFCGIRADFHPPFSDIKHEIVINPQMAFGTGHHATTYMMLDLMSGIVFTDRKVLDYGCGTGVLAILAAFLGGSPVDAVDIEKPAYDNTLVNAQRNGVSEIRVIDGTLESVIDQGYQVILANINRNVILDTLPALRKKLEADGILLVSGILSEDRALVEQAAAAAGFALAKAMEREGWVALQFSRP